MVMQEVIEALNLMYSQLVSLIPGQYQQVLSVFIFALFIAFYSIFTWKFYKFLSKKDLIGLNLAQYNTLDHPTGKKVIAVLLYLLEYALILPFLIFFWFFVFAIIILLLSNDTTINQIIIVSAAIVAAIRMLAYYTEELSIDVAKVFPLTLLVIFIASPGFFSLGRVINNLAQVPELLGSIVSFGFLIIGVELVLRILDLIGLGIRSEKN